MSFTEPLEELVAANENGLLSIHSSWKRVKLRDICSILNGFPFPSKQFKPAGGKPVIRIRDVIRGWTETHFVGDYEAEYLVRPGELILGMDGDFKCALWPSDEALLNQRVSKLTPEERYYDKRLLAFALQGYLDAINAKTSSVTVKHLSSATVAEIPLPLPPRLEQERLVKAIDSYLSRVDDAVATLERVQRNLKRYRASVLKAAVEGRLVPTEAEVARAEGRDYETASVLLERILTERRRRWEENELAKMKANGKTLKDDTWKMRYAEPAAPDTTALRELPEGWCWLSVDALAFVTKLAGFEYTKFVRYSDDGDLAVIKAENAGPEGFRPTEYSRVDSKTVSGLSRSRVTAGDLLMVFVGAGTGNVARVPAGKNYFLGPNIAMIRPQAISGAYLELYLRSSEGRSLALGFAKAVAQPSLSMGSIRQIAVAVPPQGEQDRIVEKQNDASQQQTWCERQSRQSTRV